MLNPPTTNDIGNIDFPVLLPASGTGTGSDSPDAAPHHQQNSSVSQSPIEDTAVVGHLLARLCEAAEPVVRAAQNETDRSVENQLAMVRLGVATSLFYALRSKHPATAAHALRVALMCSSWAEQSGLSSTTRDQIEVAALLHDVGKIGISDRILRKPGKLTVDEQLAMDTCPQLGCEILAGCTSDHELLDIVRYGNAWYHSRRDTDFPHGDALPLGARMLAIANAFDAMTTDHVYRSAMSRDRALAELVRGGGTQFDPLLVADFCLLLEQRPEILQGSLVKRWLEQLRPADSAAFWSGSTSTPATNPADQQQISDHQSLFNQRLFSSLKDGITFTDSEDNVTHWNLAMQRLTSIPAEAMIGKKWSTTALCLRDLERDREKPTMCPLDESVRKGEAVQRSMIIEAADADPRSVLVEVTPVIGQQSGAFGAVIIIHDLSDRVQLERRLQTLHKQTCLDGLTRVANRGHFDETLDGMVGVATSGGETFALVICDLDHFKRINDIFGHQAGDEALKVFANLLRSHSREGDLVARYGGEEFVLLAASCDNATGTKRAEIIRRALETATLDCLGGEKLTASFGVTEFQSGDSSETVLARADRALLKAKDNGRNRVVQLGLGKMSEFQEPIKKVGWFEWLTGNEAQSTTVTDIVTPVPIEIVIEKLRGFIADHQAEIINVAENQLSLKMISSSFAGGRRRVDHRIEFQVRLTLSDAQKDEVSLANPLPGCNTKVHLELKPSRLRDRRRREMKAASKQLLDSFRCYLMGEFINR